MPLILLLGVFLPRVALFCMWLFTDYLGRAYDGILWLVLGFIFLPYTTIAYALAENQGGGVHGIWIAVMVIAVLVDLGAFGSGRLRKRD